MALLTGVFADILEEQRETQRVAALVEQRTSLENPATPLSFPAEWLLDIFNGGRTDAGVRVGALTALQVTTFLSCVDLIAGCIAALPLHVYERTFTKNGRAIHRVAYDHDYYDLIHLEPNDEMSRATMIKSFCVHFLVWGNAYIEVQRDAGNRLIALWPRNPAKTMPKRLAKSVILPPEPWRPYQEVIKAGELCYVTTDGVEDQIDSENDGAKPANERIISAADMLHVPGLSLDGRVGQDVVYLSRQLLGLALATEKFGAKYFANFARPGGILELPAIDKRDREAAKLSWQEAQGGENSHRVAVMPVGAKFTPMSHNAQDAQTVETRKHLRNEICALFHVPPHMVGDVDKGRANTEQLAQEFVSYTIGPWLAAIKQEFKRKLFPHPGVGRAPKSRFYIDFDLWEMTRPNAADQEKYFATGRQWGYLNANDVRARIGENPIDAASAEDYWMPINMTLTDTPVDPTHQDGAGNGDVPDANAQDRALALSYERLFRDAMGRVLARTDVAKRDLRCIQNAFAPILFSIRDSIARELKVTDLPQSVIFIGDYLSAMQKRTAEWNDSSADAELTRAIGAIRSVVLRDVAESKPLGESQNG